MTPALAGGLSVANRRMITATVMLASILQGLDNTIANVALPHMQGSLSASQDQISWVLTAYIVAAAIATPLTGWLASRFGRRPVFVVSVAAFTVASGLCGLAQTLPEIVLFRVVQGLAGAALVPLSQAVLFDINPPERHGVAMAAWGQGVLLGPMIGPILGGWLTDNYSWRWVFFINLPLGVIALLGVLAFLPSGETRRSRFDFTGFALLSLTIGAFQVMLDRGSTKDWFESTEIIVEAIAAGLALYLFIVHSVTSRDPFIRLSLFADRNFLTGNLIIFVIGVVLFATLALLPTFLQSLMDYPVYDAGLLTAPRSLGTMIGMGIVGRLIQRFDPRLIMAVGFAITIWSLYLMLNFSLDMDAAPVFWSGILQGLGTGIVYVPMAAITFATLTPALRNEGSAMFSLMRNIGSSIGISVVQALLIRNIQTMHLSLATHALAYNAPNRDPELARALLTHVGTAAYDARLTAQAAMIAYLDDFKVMFVLAVLSLPLLLLLRRPRSAAPDDELIHVAIE